MQVGTLVSGTWAGPNVPVTIPLGHFTAVGITSARLVYLYAAEEWLCHLKRGVVGQFSTCRPCGRY